MKRLSGDILRLIPTLRFRITETLAIPIGNVEYHQKIP
jgi:hypothetical protein